MTLNKAGNPVAIKMTTGPGNI